QLGRSAILDREEALVFAQRHHDDLARQVEIVAIEAAEERGRPLEQEVVDLLELRIFDHAPAAGRRLTLELRAQVRRAPYGIGGDLPLRERLDVARRPP